MTLPAKVVATIRPDTVFIPYHWPGRQAANQLTNRALDPLSKIPEYKVSAVRIERAGDGEPSSVVDERDVDLVGGRDATSDAPPRSPSEPGEGGG
jgi:assimilatory nitrate reductase catalytic subunit